MDIANSVNGYKPSGDIIADLESYEAPFLKERLLGKVFITEDSYEKSFSEFKRYLVLLMLGHKNIPMTSRSVDIIWHQFILFTKEYHEFCNRFFGRYLHHIPETSSNQIQPDEKNKIFEVYKEVFNDDVPQIWGSKKDNDEYTVEDLIPLMSPYLQDFSETVFPGGLSFSNFGCRGCEECSGDGDNCKNSIEFGAIRSHAFDGCDGCAHCSDGTCSGLIPEEAIGNVAGVVSSSITTR